MPKSNIPFWENKIYANKIRDSKNRSLLKKKQGWQIIIVWECKVNEKNKVKTVVNKLLILLYQNRIYLSLLIMHLIV